MRFLSVLILSLCISAPAVDAGTITLTGHGEVATAPDMATITLGVQSEAADASVALRDTSAKTAEILAVLEGSDIDARDMQTSDLSLNPMWDNRKMSENGRPKVAGFMARNTLTIRVRDLERLGAVLDAVVSVGANNLHGLQFGVQNPQPLQDDARVRAVADAKRKAALYAEAAGVTLGPILSINEVGHRAPGPQVVMEMAQSRMDVPVAEGAVGLSADVSIIFAIEN